MSFETMRMTLLPCYWSGSTGTRGYFRDLYFDRYHQHFMVMHNSGMPFNVGHPQRFVGAQLHNAFPVGDKPSPKAKLPPAFLDHPTKFPIDSCIREYRDWTTDCEDR